MSDDAATKKNDRAKLLKKLRIAVIGLAAGLALGIFGGVVLVRSNALGEGSLGAFMGICTYATGHVLFEAYRYWRVPRGFASWANDYEAMLVGTIHAGVRFAECQAALATMIERCPKPFEDVIMLTSELGHVAHREVLLRAEELGLAPKICWRERQGAPSVPTVGTTCHVHCKQRQVTMKHDASRVGDVWTYVALDAETKLVPCFRVDKRDGETTYDFLTDFASRLQNRVQISTDWLRMYADMIPEIFGGEVDFATVVKSYEAEPAGNGKYSP